MRAKNRLFNHPVLSIYNDDYSQGVFELEVKTLDISEFELRLSIDFILDEESIETLLNDKLAAFAILIECPKTTERYYYQFNDKNVNIEIPNANLNDFIRIQSFIISNTFIDNFYSQNFNDLFDNTRFQIPPKSILAFSKEIKAKLNFANNDLSSIQSIFKIIKRLDLKDNDIQVEKESDFLQIFMSERRYHEYIQIKKLTKHNPEIMHATLIIPTLTYVISTLNKEELEAYDYPWFNALSHSLQEKGLILDKNLLENKSSFEIANFLMASPTLTSMSAINQVFQITMEGDDEY